MSEAICALCSSPIISARGLCKRCYSRMLAHGRLDEFPLIPFVPQECSVAGCERQSFAKGVCRKHYQRLRKTGSLSPPARIQRPLWLRIVLGRDIDAATGCWMWHGYRHPKGYGRIRVTYYDAAAPYSKSESAHRMAYKAFIGPIPNGLEIDHLCFNRACCNPEHLEAVTAAENMRRMGQRRIEHNKQNRPVVGK